VTTVGYVGADVPRELIEAAGLRPLRLAPVPVESVALADAILGPGVDEPTRLVLAGLLERRYPIDALVLCHDSEHTVRLYTSLRALGPELPLHFFDLLHLPTAATAAYDLVRIRELVTVLEEWGDPIERDVLAEAIDAANRSRRLLGRLDGLRQEGSATGVEVLEAVVAGYTVPAEEHVARLEALVETPRRKRSAKRVFLLGSAHDTPEVYAAIEAAGATVVGERHSWGASSFATLVDESAPALEALVERYAMRPAPAPVDADLVLAWLRLGDEGLGWQLPAEPRVDTVLRRRPYRLDDDARAELAAAVA
jgi:benzoyl-CoA reductase/2-hydroxyglutaryl-CoA dehydratase subunit BcrC/BadD/HgdB